MGRRGRVARLVSRRAAESRFNACSSVCRSRCTRRAEHPQRRSWQSAHSHVPIGIRIWHGWQMPPQRKPVWSMGELRSSSAGHSPNRLGVRSCSAEASSAVISSRLRSAAKTEVLMATQCGAELPGTSAVHTRFLDSRSSGCAQVGSSAGCRDRDSHTRLRGDLPDSSLQVSVGVRNGGAHPVCCPARRTSVQAGPASRSCLPDGLAWAVCGQGDRVALAAVGDVGDAPLSCVGTHRDELARGAVNIMGPFDLVSWRNVA